MSVDPRRSLAVSRRLQFILALMIVWDIIALLVEGSFGGAFFKASGGQISGLLAGRGSFSGVMLVPICIYVYAIVRGPLRHPGVLWAGAIEQGAAALAAVYHYAAKDIKLQGTLLPLVVALVLLVLLLTQMPRGKAIA